MQAFSGVKYIKIFRVFVNQVYGISQIQQKVVFYSCSLVKLRGKNWVCQYPANSLPPPVGHVPPPLSFPPPPPWSCLVLVSLRLVY